MSKPIILALILSLLVVSGCATTKQPLIASPNFVEEYLPAVLGVEGEYNEITAELKMARWLGIDLEPIKDELTNILDIYWVYYRAAHTYLTSGDLSRYKQAVGRAENALQKVRDLLEKAEKAAPQEAPPESSKPKRLSL
ncbi:hypothetical protein LCGC14_2372110 [marine sediment metagenome]|uniref:Uncharacterized protein n=1 Tax=marine sediment metagenome TaxID=412755 RepID=A0A0F9CQR3_9ZZZZ